MNFTSFTSKQVEELTGLKVRTQHVYVEAGIITPDVQAASGTGTVRYYSATNLVEAEMISYFIGFGLPKRTIASFFASINERNDRTKLDPLKVLNCEGDITLFILPDPIGKLAHHSFVTSKGLMGDREYMGGNLDFNDYDIWPIKLKIDLSYLVKRLIEKMESL